MTSIKLIVNGAKAKAEVDGILTSGSVGIPVTIQYDSTWNGLTKNLVCTSGKWGPTGKPRTILDIDTSAMVAHEVMIADNHLYLGVEGRNADGTLVIPTVWANCGTIFPGANASADPSANPTLPIWAQLQMELKKLKQAGVSDEQIAAAIEHYFEQNPIKNPNGNGLTAAQVNALNGMFKVCAFTKADISTEYSAFQAAFGLSDSGDSSSGEDSSGTGEGGESGGDTVTYTVTNNLTNVTNSNSATSAKGGGAYSATLTVTEGYMLDSLIITHNGKNVTDAVYGDGYILIANVSGDIVITATASEPQYVDIATGISTDAVNLYSDAGTAKLATRYYQNGAYSLSRTETDASVKVVLTNNTESDVSTSNVYIGSTDAQAIRNPNSSINVHHAISGAKGMVAPGASVEIAYTVKAGYWAYVCGYGNLSVSIIGSLNVHEPVNVLETTSRQIDTFTVYSDDGTTQLDRGTYRTAYATTELFNSDTELLITVVSGGPNSGTIMYGGVESGALTANVSAHYGDNAVVKSFATGAKLIFSYTVKAGYYFAILPCSGATVYIEKA